MILLAPQNHPSLRESYPRCNDPAKRGSVCADAGLHSQVICTLPCYLVPSSRVRLLVIAMIIFLQVSRSLGEPHSSVSVQFVTALMSSSQRARGLPLFLEPPPIPSIIDFSKLFSLRMICPKYDSCCFFISVSNGLVALISSITDLLVRLAVHGIRSAQSSPAPQLKAVNSSSLCFSYRPGFTTIQHYWEN